MPKAVTKVNLRSWIRQRLEMENDDSVTDSELDDLIDEGLAALHQLLLHNDDSYAEAQVDITTTGAQDYDVPTDWYDTVSIEWVKGTQDRRELIRTNLKQRHRCAVEGDTGDPVSYRIILSNTAPGGSIRFIPTPPSGQTLRHYYITQPPEFNDDADTYYSWARWWKYIVLHVCVEVRRKLELDRNPFADDLAALRLDIEAESNQRRKSPIPMVDPHHRRRNIDWYYDRS